MSLPRQDPATGVWSPPYHLSPPIHTSEAIGRNEVLHGKIDGRDGIYMHPVTFHAMRISVEDGRPMSDPHVQLDAALAWVLERIERRGRAAAERLDAMARRFQMGDDARAVLASRCPGWRSGWMSPTPVGEHDWEMDEMRRVLKCPDCGASLTAEAFALAGSR